MNTNHALTSMSLDHHVTSSRRGGLRGLWRRLAQLSAAAGVASMALG